MNQPRYLLNLRRKIYHDTHYNNEQCNVDDNKDLVENASIPNDYRICKHCKRQRDKEQA